MSEDDENKRNRLILIALVDVFGVEDFDEAFKAASKLKADVDGGIYVLYNKGKKLKGNEND